MELVYLWVEDYKNIKKQGFNFSPKFNCKYDENTNELTIDEKKDYVSIFPENINITAIVGENGSGKSTLFEILSIDYRSYRNAVLIIVENNGEIEYFSNKISLENYMKCSSSFTDKTIYFSNNLSTFTNKSNTPKIFNNIPKRFEQNLAKLYKEIFNDEYFSIYETELGLLTLNLQEILLKNPDTFEHIDKRASFTNYKYQLDFSILSKNIKSDEFYMKSISNSKKNEVAQLLKFIIISRWKSSFIYGRKVNVIIKKNRKIFEKENFTIADYSFINEKLNKLSIIDEYSTINIENFVNMFDYKEKELWITKEFFSIDYKVTHSLLTTWRFFFYLRINFYKGDNEELDYISFSSGEKEYIKLLINFIYVICNKENKRMYFLDEVDLSLHPLWQKRIINDLINFIKLFEIEREIQLIFSTHSPFIISDVPKNNIIFLKEGKEENAFSDNETFGANIHTLLSNVFFMGEGLMGEFAKKKIDDVIKILNSKRKLSKKNQKYCKDIISIIGEPILKTTLENMYEEKTYEKESKLEKLKRKQKALDKEILELEQKPNEKG